MLKGGRVTRPIAIAGNALEEHPRVLELVALKVYGTKAWGLLDTGAVPNVISVELVKALSLTHDFKPKGITVANGVNCPTLGSVKNVPISFDGETLHMDFLAVEGSPFDIVIGIPTMALLRTKLDFERQVVRMTINKRTLEVPLELGIGKQPMIASGTDSADFTSESDLVPFSSSSSDEETNQDELVLAILNDPTSDRPSA